MRNEHTWKEKTDDGDKREVRAVKFGKAWRIQSKLKGEATWTYHEPPLTADLRELRDVLFRKYQRRRATYEELTDVENILKQREREEAE
ncbi:MAG: hypothetical protein QOD99_1833 [Chthoniobacter sp.]|jgi:hypothetical protein|nr:hypothetical protein [Chthoniobacter sp.]